MDLLAITKLLGALSKLKEPRVYVPLLCLLAVLITLGINLYHTDKNTNKLISHGAMIKDLQDETKQHVVYASFSHWIDHADKRHQEQEAINRHVEEEIGDMKQNVGLQFTNMAKQYDTMDKNIGELNARVNDMQKQQEVEHDDTNGD